MNTYEMDPRLRPLFPGIFFAGIASTAEYRVVNHPIPRLTYEEFDERQYKKGPDGKGAPDALWKGGNKMGAPDEVQVIDTQLSRCGLLGSNNVLDAKIKGTVGFIIDGACRNFDRVHQSEIAGVLRHPLHAPHGRTARTRHRQPADQLRWRAGPPRRRRHRRR